ncbi:MAG: signal peptidase [Verrucomicrobia bacterium]|nr:signal peptidase [Verrucomicrobiota bacterium]
MFGLFASADSKMRESATNWLEVADKVWHFRRDVLSAKDAAELRQETEQLRQEVKAKAGAAALKENIESLEGVLRRTGGAIYPKSALVENVEFLLVAALVIIGVRTFFVQPFKIPTNSMWPTYNGMTPEIFSKPADEPGPLAVAARAVAFGAWPHRLDAPVDGEVLIPFYGGPENRAYVHSHNVPGHTWLVLPTTLREYTIFVGDRSLTLRLPLDFDFDWVASDAFFQDGTIKSPRDFIEKVNAKIRAGAVEMRNVDGYPTYCVRTGRFVKAGERVLSFDERTGDQLFVDRVTYNFSRPEVGQGFVFSTRNIPRINQDQYFVKRLIGVPGDTIEIHEPAIYRNGQPITGAPAFERNAQRTGKYRGYFNGPSDAQYLQSPADKLTVPPASFFAMGDNSGSSFDSRYWGFVAAKDVIGRPLFIYFPFTSHWGPTR